MKEASDQKQRQMVLNAFRKCHRRISTRRRWNLLFSLLLPVCVFWLLCVLANQFHLIPFGNTVSQIVLGLGTVGVLIITWRTQTDLSYAAYVFDRMNQFDGAFLTWFYGQQEVSEDTPVQTALLLKLHEKLNRKMNVPSRGFPAGKAFATAGFLVTGLIAGFMLDPTVESDVRAPSSSSRQIIETKINNRAGRDEVEPSSSNQKSDLQTETRADELIRQLHRLKKDLAETRSDDRKVPDELVKRRDRLESNMKSFLKTHESATTSDQTSEPGPGEPPGNSQPKSQQRVDKQNGQTDNGTPVEGETDDTTLRQTKKRKQQNTSVDQIKEAYQTLTREDFFQTTEVESSEVRSSSDGGSSGIASNMPKSSAGTVPESSINIQPDVLNEALNRSDRVRDWSPKYDRSIEAYRSFLRTYFHNRETNENTR